MSGENSATLPKSASWHAPKMPCQDAALGSVEVVLSRLEPAASNIAGSDPALAVVLPTPLLCCTFPADHQVFHPESMEGRRKSRTI